VPILALLLLVAVVVVSMHPDWGLPVALFLLWTNTAQVLSFYHGAPTALAAIVPLLLIAPVLDGRFSRERLRVDSGLIWMLVILLVEVVASLASANQDVGLGRVEKFVQEGLIVYLLLINVIRTPDALRMAVWALITAGVALSAITLVQELGHRYDHTFFGFGQLDHAYLQGKDSNFRAQGPVDDANYYAQLLLVPFTLALVAALRERARRARIWASLGALVMLVAIIFTYSRGAALAVVALLPLLMALRYLRFQHVIAVVCVGALLLVLFPQYGSRIASLGTVGGATAQVGSSNAADLSIQQRATENLAAWLAVQDHPLLGLGPGSFPLEYQYYASKVGGAIHGVSKHVDPSGQSAGQAPQRAVPNILLSVAADQGMIGLAVFICLLSSAVLGLLAARRRWTRRDRELDASAMGLLLALVSYVLAGIFLALAFERYLWALLALCSAAAFVLMRDSRALAASTDKLATLPRRPPHDRGFVPDKVGGHIPGRWDEISHAGGTTSSNLEKQ
jgi:putative inorganic carbon (hco3(-)) transporter